MTEAKLCYWYDIIDKRNEFGLENPQNIFWQWVWFYLGRKLKNKIELYPFIPHYEKDCEILFELSNVKENAQKIALHISKKIKQKLRQLQKRKVRHRWK